MQWAKEIAEFVNNKYKTQVSIYMDSFGEFGTIRCFVITRPGCIGEARESACDGPGVLGKTQKGSWITHPRQCFWHSYAGYLSWHGNEEQRQGQQWLCLAPMLPSWTLRVTEFASWCRFQSILNDVWKHFSFEKFRRSAEIGTFTQLLVDRCRPQYIGCLIILVPKFDT